MTATLPQVTSGPAPADADLMGRTATCGNLRSGPSIGCMPRRAACRPRSARGHELGFDHGDTGLRGHVSVRIEEPERQGVNLRKLLELTQWLRDSHTPPIADGLAQSARPFTNCILRVWPETLVGVARDRQLIFIRLGWSHRKRVGRGSASPSFLIRGSS